MAWDANRPIPWRRVLREATIFIVIGALAIAFLVDDPRPDTFVGLVIGMIFYVAFVALLSKFGYQRQSLRDAREKRQAMAAAPTAAAAARQRPAPTRRTSTGPSQRPNRSTKKRRR